MAERPILFSAPMVRALLAGTKTQTRRLVNPQPFADGYYEGEVDGTFVPAPASNLQAYARFGAAAVGGGAVRTEAFTPRIQPGDTLWVRESGHLLREAYGHDPGAREDLWRDAGFCHAADGEIVSARRYDPPLREWIGDCSRINRPSIHMPRWASRLTLTVTEVRVERLQDISERDAEAEGINVDLSMPADSHRCWIDLDPSTKGADWLTSWDAKDVYRQLWHVINGRGSWETNPWVVAYSFAVESRGIGALAGRAG